MSPGCGRREESLQPQGRVLAGETCLAVPAPDFIADLPEPWYRAKKPPGAKGKQKGEAVSTTLAAEDSNVHLKGLLGWGPLIKAYTTVSFANNNPFV